MYVMGTTDLSSYLSLSRRTSDVKQALLSANAELASGRVNSLNQTSGGDLRRLYALEANSAAAGSDQVLLNLAKERSDAAMLRLQSVRGALGTTGVDLKAAIGLGDIQRANAVAETAPSKIETVISSLNATYGGRSLFAGAASDVAPLADRGTLMADIFTALAGATDLPTVEATLDTYFDTATGGFQTNIWQGSNVNTTSYLSGGEAISGLPRANDPSIAGLLKGLVMTALSVDPGFLGSAQDQQDLQGAAADLLLAVEDPLLDLQQGLGERQGTEERLLAEVTARKFALDMDIAEITQVDSYDAASRVQAFEGQLSLMYTMTARLAGLNLNNAL